MSETPRSDEFFFERSREPSAVAMLKLARTLERELAAVTAERDRMRPVVDCRLCKNYIYGSGGCISTFTCVDASQFKASEPHRYWISEAAK